MTRSLAAHFDGKVIIPAEPVQLPVGELLHVQVSVGERHQSMKKKGKRKIVGLGQFTSGKKDLGSNKEHLKGFGK